MTYEYFKSQMAILVHFVDDMSREDIEEVMNEWYALYKSYPYKTLLDWVDMHFTVVSRDSNDYWLDARGRKLLELENRLNAISPIDIFPIAGLKRKKT